MNERIEELAKECYVKTGSDHTDHFAYWKFAELIVRECAKVAFDDWCDGTNERSSQMAILKHFGVEE